MRQASEVVNYLSTRGFDVGGQAAFGPKTGVMVNGVLLTDYEARVLATYESCKDENAEPDGLALEYMAKACLKISEHPAAHSLSANEGRELAKRFEDWKNSDIDFPIAQLRVLCKRMAYFLTREFGLLWGKSRLTPIG
jgi:hypothetical protein